MKANTKDYIIHSLIENPPRPVNDTMVIMKGSNNNSGEGKKKKENVKRSSEEAPLGEQKT